MSVDEAQPFKFHKAKDPLEKLFRSSTVDSLVNGEKNVIELHQQAHSLTHQMPAIAQCSQPLANEAPLTKRSLAKSLSLNKKVKRKKATPAHFEKPTSTSNSPVLYPLLGTHSTTSTFNRTVLTGSTNIQRGPVKRTKSSNDSSSSSFPGIPVHLIEAKKISPQSTQKEIDKTLKRARKELEALYTTELLVKQRIQALQVHEQQLIKSCETLAELAEDPGDQIVSEKLLRKTKKVTTAVINEQKHFLKLDTRKIQIGELIGTGASGASVFLVSVDGWCCAMKELPRDVCSQIDSECFEKEMAILYQMPHHPNIARYLFHRKYRGRYCLFTMRYSSTLRREIDKRKEMDDFFSVRIVTKIAFEIANGLSFLHSMSIMHRDLKTDNIFITVNRTGQIRDVAIGDFDTAKRLGVSAKPVSTVGTVGFMAPEVLDACGRNAYSYSADVFSFGMLLYEIMTLEYPYYECDTPFKVSGKILSGEPPLITAEQQNQWALLLPVWYRCIAKNPDERIKTSELRDELLKLCALTDSNKHVLKKQESKPGGLLGSPRRSMGLASPRLRDNTAQRLKQKTDRRSVRKNSLTLSHNTAEIVNIVSKKYSSDDLSILRTSNDKVEKNNVDMQLDIDIDDALDRLLSPYRDEEGNEHVSGLDSFRSSAGGSSSINDSRDSDDSDLAEFSEDELFLHHYPPEDQLEIVKKSVDRDRLLDQRLNLLLDW